MLVLRNVVHAHISQEVAGSSQPDALGDGGRAGLEAAGGVGEGRPLQEDLVDHLPSSLPRRHVPQHLAAAVQESHARRPAHLVARGHEEVAAQPPHVHRHVRHRLAAVDEHLGPDGVRLPYDVLHGVNAAQRVGHMRHRHHLQRPSQQHASTTQSPVPDRRLPSGEHSVDGRNKWRIVQRTVLLNRSDSLCARVTLSNTASILHIAPGPSASPWCAARAGCGSAACPGSRPPTTEQSAGWHLCARRRAARARGCCGAPSRRGGPRRRRAGWPGPTSRPPG
mmetsp:Transcript_26854/g.70588  ORF Transcript_26854/g.70588 Transcript_26854/m.70588 type:complete len:280 (+) Transcript_26854:978-1817(+)